MHPKLLSLIALSFLAWPLYAEDKQPPATAGYDEAGVSFTIPAGWEVREFPGFKNRIVVGAPAKNFAPNINLVEEKFQGSLSDYVDATEKSISGFFEEYKKLSRTELKSDVSVPMLKLVITAKQGRQRLRQTFLFFAGAQDKKFVLTCTTLLEDGEKLDETFEAVARSLKVRQAEK